MSIMAKKQGLTTEEYARREYEVLCDPLVVKVKVPVSWANGICLPDAKGKQYEEAQFKVLTFGDNHVIDKAVSYDKDIVENGRVMTTVTATDLNEYRKLLVRRNLLGWSLDIPIERQGGWMTDACWDRVKNVPAPLMDAFLELYDEHSSITKKEEEKIMRQSSVLFGKNSRGVSDACEAVSLFCTLGNFWDKFGVGRGTPIHELPLKEYMMLKIVISRENEASRVHSSPKRPLTRIAGPGGRPRASQGIVMGE
jgi:hypothetical protein